VLAVVVFRGNKNYNKLETERIERTFEIKQLKSLNERIEASNDKLAADNIRLNDLQIVHELKSDSLEKIINQIEQKPSRVGSLRKQQINELKTALKICERSKGVYVKRIGLKNDIQINNDVIIDNFEQLQTLDKKKLRKAKRKSFVKGLVSGGIIVTALFILL
jgi:hypothetical protein